MQPDTNKQKYSVDGVDMLCKLFTDVYTLYYLSWRCYIWI